MGERILSIQSHVTYGYVGGKAAVFPLQCLGFNVDAVNTVNFSNHSGYGRFGGSKATASELSEIFRIMDANKLLTQSRLLTGYIPGAEALAVIAELAKKLRANKPELIYLLDPVLGDSGKLYVAPEVVPIYRSLLPHATIITPNWFEVETLTQVKLGDLNALRKAFKIIHEEFHVPHVVMSSMPLREPLRNDVPSAFRVHEQDPVLEINGGDLICISSSVDDPTRASTVHAHIFPSIPGYFSGVGDLFSAMVLAHFDPQPASPPQPPSSASSAPSPRDSTPLSRAVASALSKTIALLRLTHQLALAEVPEDDRTPTDEEKDRADPERVVRRMRGRELRLIEGQALLRDGAGAGVPLTPMKLWETFWEKDDCTR